MSSPLSKWRSQAPSDALICTSYSRGKNKTEF